MNEATAWGSQLHVPIHTNAATTFARGTRFGYYPGRSDSAAACNIFKKHWVKLYPNPAKVKTTTYTFFEARTPKMPSVYVELIFHDNKEDAAWFHQYMDAAAKTLVDAIADYFGVYTGSDAQPMRSPADGRIVKVRIEKEENARYLGVPVGTVISLPIEEYLMGVVPQEVSNWHVELCKAQAIAARSIACYWTRNG